MPLLGRPHATLTYQSPATRAPRTTLGKSSDFPCLETRPHSCYPFVVTVPVQHAGFVVDCSFGDEEVGDRRSVPHAAVVG